MKVAVLLSGGVDSSVALHMLRSQGHCVTAFYLKIWLEDELSFLGSCPWEEDLRYVQTLCKDMKVPLEVLSLQREYWDHVVSYTIASLREGKTPNPDMLCNQRIKFGMFYDKIDASFDKIATGHYAQVSEEGIYRLKMSPDSIKDQTYFLACLSQKQLSRALFPIGHLTKNEVRAYAAAHNLVTKDRKDSQGICFLGKLKFNEFVKYHLGEQRGLLVEHETDKIVGEHQGYWFYTIGQRHGIGLAGGPWYVVEKNINENIVRISRSYYTHDKLRDMVSLVGCSWLTGSEPQENKVMVKLRHGPHIYKADLMRHADGYHLKLDDHDQGIAPGQFAVLYHEGWCLGGGEIVRSNAE
jgi:tRNA (5-methylaminomethyl-2-thiouridylate)-methyltransferase